MDRYGIKKFSELTHTDRHTLLRWRNAGKFVPAIHEGDRFYYSKEQLDAFIKNKQAMSYGDLIERSDREIDFRKVPRVPNKKSYDWHAAIATHAPIPFTYKGIDGVIYITGIKGNTLSIQYNDKPHYIKTDSLKACNLAFLTGNFTKDYKYAPGDKIHEGNTDITIIRAFRKSAYRKKAYEYICNKCHQKNIVEEYNISDKGVCPVCAGKIVVQGINDIATTAPWMIKYLPDPQIAYTHTHSSHDAYYMICPFCKRKSSHKIHIGTLYRTHSIGCVCSDGYSYPNKFMHSVLEQLKEARQIQEFIAEWSPEWLGRKAFDFYIVKDAQTQLVVELDGGLGHGRRSFTNDDKQESLNRDAWKDAQAKSHGLNVSRIDAEDSSVEYLSKQITESLESYFSFDLISWKKADEFATSNLVEKVCRYYELHKPISTRDVATRFNISTSTALKYLKKGEQFGWDTYDKSYGEELKIRYLVNGKNTSGRPVVCYTKDGTATETYKTIVDAAKAHGVSATAIANCCKGKTRQSCGYIWRYKNEAEHTMG